MSKAERLAQLIIVGLMTSARPLVPGTQEAWTKHVAEFLEPHLVGEWRDIESAPKGIKVLLWRESAGKFTGGCWIGDWADWCQYPYKCTHWQHLPAPPKGEQSAR